LNTLAAITERKAGFRSLGGIAASFPEELYERRWSPQPIANSL
jgi:hypothetical protein